MFENTYVATSGSGNISDQQFVGEVFIERSKVHPAFDTYNVIFLNDDAMWPSLRIIIGLA
jgi:hypothetical protein